MPRNGSGVYSKPSGTTPVSGDTVSPTAFNTLMDDFVSDANAARPVTAGGTGGTSASTARSGLEVARVVRGKTTAPTANDDASGTAGAGVFDEGDVWIDETANAAYVCVDATATAAVWTSTTASTIADGSVSNAKLTDMAEATIKGRAAGAGIGAPTDLTATQVAAILGVNAKGELLTSDGSAVAALAVGTDGQVLTADSAEATGVKWSAPAVLQHAYAETKSVDTSTTVIPNDDTIPQITEGKEILTVSITPRSATSKLLIDVSVMWSDTGGSGAQVQFAVFQDAVVDAIAAVGEFAQNNSYLIQTRFSFRVDASSTTARTYRLRAGPAGATTTTINGLGGARKFGGVAVTSITVLEVSA